MTKNHTIEQVLAGHIKAVQHMYVQSGKNSFFNYTLKNNFSKKVVYTIQIQDPDIEYLSGVSELQLVKNDNREWEYWYEQGKCEAPPVWDNVIKRNNEILLEPNEEIPLLFKFTSFRQFSKGRQSDEDYIQKRCIQVIFHNSIDKELTSIQL